MPILLAQLEIASPGRLLVLVLLPALVYLAIRGRHDVAGWQRFTSTGLRCLVFGLLCLAWAAPSCRVASDRQFIVVAVDRSVSAAPNAEEVAETVHVAAGAQQNAVVRWISFGGISVAEDPTTDSGVVPAQTNIAGALYHGQALCPPDHVGKLVVVTDGLENAGSSLSAAAGASLPLSVLPAQAFSGPEVAVDQIVTPGEVAPYEKIDVEIVVSANHPDTVDLALLRNGVQVVTESIDVRQGRNYWRTRLDPLQSDTMLLQAVVSGGSDTIEENNALAAIVVRRRLASVMIIGEPAATQFLAELFLAGECDVDIRKPEDAPTSYALPGTDSRIANSQVGPGYSNLVILSEVAAKDFTRNQLAALDRYAPRRGRNG